MTTFEHKLETLTREQLVALSLILYHSVEQLTRINDVALSAIEDVSHKASKISIKDRVDQFIDEL